MMLRLEDRGAGFQCQDLERPVAIVSFYESTNSHNVGKVTCTVAVISLVNFLLSGCSRNRNRGRGMGEKVGTTFISSKFSSLGRGISKL